MRTWSRLFFAATLAAVSAVLSGTPAEAAVGIKVKVSEIRTGKLVITGSTTAKPGSYITIDGTAFKARVRSDRRFSFGIKTWLPPTCKATLRAGTRVLPIVVGNCGPQGKSGPEGSSGITGIFTYKGPMSTIPATNGTSTDFISTDPNAPVVTIGDGGKIVLISQVLARFQGMSTFDSATSSACLKAEDGSLYNPDPSFTPITDNQLEFTPVYSNIVMAPPPGNYQIGHCFKHKEMVGILISTGQIIAMLVR